MSDLFNETDRSGKGVVPGLGRRAPDRSERTKRVHAAFGFVGLLVAIAAAIFAYNETSSIALPIFVFIFVQAYIGRGLGDVATDPEKGKRFVYFTLQPVAAFGVLYLTYQWWGLMWLAAILGGVIGGALWALAGAVFFPKIQQEETEDTERRSKTGGL